MAKRSLSRRWVGLGVVLGVAAATGVAVTVARPARAQSAPGLSVSGVWNTQWAGAASVLTLLHQGRYLTGTYTVTASQPGALAGEFHGYTLTGRWTDSGSSGGFVLTFAPDGRSFSGTWGRTPASTNSGGPWVGSR